MNDSTTGPTLICGYCGKPLIGEMVCGAGVYYHPECTRGPGYIPQVFQPIPSADQTATIARLTAERDAMRKERDELKRMQMAWVDQSVQLAAAREDGERLAALKRFLDAYTEWANFNDAYCAESADPEADAADLDYLAWKVSETALALRTAHRAAFDAARK